MKGTTEEVFRPLSRNESGFDILEDILQCLIFMEKTNCFYDYAGASIYYGAINYKGPSGPLMKIILGKDEI